MQREQRGDGTSAGVQPPERGWSCQGGVELVPEAGSVVKRCDVTPLQQGSSGEVDAGLGGCIKRRESPRSILGLQPIPSFVRHCTPAGRRGLTTPPLPLPKRRLWRHHRSSAKPSVFPSGSAMKKQNVFGRQGRETGVTPWRQSRLSPLPRPQVSRRSAVAARRERCRSPSVDWLAPLHAPRSSAPAARVG